MIPNDQPFPADLFFTPGCVGAVGDGESSIGGSKRLGAVEETCLMDPNTNPRVDHVQDE